MGRRTVRRKRGCEGRLGETLLASSARNFLARALESREREREKKSSSQLLYMHAAVIVETFYE